jgi:hypothetical protein
VQYAKLMFLMTAVIFVSSSCTKTTSRDEAADRYFKEHKTYSSNEYKRRQPLETERNYWHFTEFVLNKQPFDNIRFGLNIDSIPNPFINDFGLYISLPDSCLVNLSVYDSMFTVVDSITLGLRPRGMYKIKWDHANKRDGVYIAKLSACDTTIERRLFLLR